MPAGMSLNTQHICDLYYSHNIKRKAHNRFMDLPSFSANEDADTYRQMAQLTGQSHGSLYNK